MAGKTAGEGAAKKRAARHPRSARQPVLLGAIDIGSNAMRMSIAEFLPDSGVRTLEELTHPVATGADTFRHGLILPPTLFAICNVLDDFIRVLDDYGVDSRRLVASSSIREAANREILIDRIHHISGMELEVLDAIEESRIVYHALLPWLRETPGNYSMALNLGGGSTEIMILRGEDLLTGGSRRLGTSRLFHSAGSGGSQSRAERLEAMAYNIVRSTSDVYQDYTISHFFLINRLLYRAFRHAPEAVIHEHDYAMPAETLREHIVHALSHSPLEIGSRFNMGLAEVEILVPAMTILRHFVAAAEVDEVTFTDTEMLSGLLAEMTMAIQGENPLISFRRQMARSARAVGEQYFYDRAHAKQVTEFSLTIFDALREMLELDDKDRMLLELAAVLHDIGMYVNELHHHRHSAYLVKWSDIVGLNENDRLLTSQIVFFHRLDLPSVEHPEFMALTREERVRVSKLAGILRLADVFDRGHRQTVKRLRVEISGEKLFIYLQIAGDMGIIMDELPKKADLVEQVTALQVVLRRELPKA